MWGGTSFGSAVEEASSGEVEITVVGAADMVYVLAIATEDATTGGVDVIVSGSANVVSVLAAAAKGDGSGSSGSGGVFSGVCRPIGRSGRRSVPLFGFGGRPSESQTIL